jgi:hypothetical protein
VGHHGDGLYPESCCLIFHRRHLCTPSHHCHQACLQSSQGLSPWDQLELPPPPTPGSGVGEAGGGGGAPSSILTLPQLPVLPGCLRTREPESLGTRQPQPLCSLWAPGSHSSDCGFPPGAVPGCFPTAQHPPWPVWDKHSQTLRILSSQCPVVEWMRDTKPYIYMHLFFGV